MEAQPLPSPPSPPVDLVIAVAGGVKRDERVLQLDADEVRALATASERFRMSVEGDRFQEATDRVVRWEVQSIEERNALRKLVHKGKRGYTQATRRPLAEALCTFLVANRFCFVGLAQEYKVVVSAAAQTTAEARAVLEGIPEEEYEDPGVQDLLGMVCGLTFLGIVALRECFVQRGRVPVTLAGVRVRMLDMMDLRSDILGVPPLALMAGIANAHVVSGNVLYMLMRIYLARSPHCEDMDDAARTRLYERLVDRLAASGRTFTPEFLSFFVTSCPYALRTGVLPRLVACNLVPSYTQPYLLRHLYHMRFEVRLRLDDLLPLKSGKSVCYSMGTYDAFPLFMEVERHARRAAEGDLFVLRPVVLCAGSVKTHACSGPRILLHFNAAEVNGAPNSMLSQDAFPGVVQFDEDDDAPHKSAHTSIWHRISPDTNAWTAVVCYGSAFFPEGEMVILLENKC